MAKKKKPVEAEETGERKEMKDLLKRIRERFKVMKEADEENRRKALDDIEFIHVPGKQWDDDLKKERGDRPCYEFNKLRVTNKRVINHIRANRPQWKTRGFEDGDKETADIYDGLMRNIWNTSDGDSVIDYEAQYAVDGGYGVMRITTEYSDDTVFDQDIYLRAVKNPFCVYSDPSASDQLKRDAEDWVVTERISNSSYDSKYPKAKRVSFDEVEFDDDAEWNTEEETRVCEYWYKKPYEKTIYLLGDGKTVEEKDLLPIDKVVDRRTVKCPKICMVIASGDAILEKPKEWAGKHFPFIPIYGEWIVINGKVVWYGLTRHSKDAQREYNASRTAVAETIAQAPTAKHWMTPKQMEGLEKHIATAHKENMPVALYNPDPLSPGAPARVGGAEVPVALIQEAQMASEDIKNTSGIFDASLGNQSNEISGKAINARQAQGEIATYNFPDNVAKSIRRTGEILIDLIPHIYDTARSIRIIGTDGAEKFLKINEPFQDETGKIVYKNDLTRGKYDLTVTTGPSFSTQRQEATEFYTQLGTAVPQIWGVAGDLIMKSMDLPYSEDIAERMRTLLPPHVQQKLAEGKEVPPEVQAAMNQANQAMAIVQQQSQLVQAAAKEAEKLKVDAEKAESKVKIAQADLKVMVAEFEKQVAEFQADVAKEVSGLIQREANLTLQGTQVEADSKKLEEERGKVNLQDDSRQAIENIKALSTDMTNSALSLIQAMAPPKTSKRLRGAKRVNGELVAQFDEVDEGGKVLSTRNGKVSRKNGEIIAAIEQLGDDGQVSTKESRFRSTPEGIVSVS